MKIVRVLSIIVGIIILLAAISFGILRWYTSPKIPSLKSDVPIEYKVGWWAYQEAVKLDELDSKIVFDNLSLFNSTSIIEFKLKGTLIYKNSWRPYIKSVHISEHWESTSSQYRVGNILITPIVAVKDDDSYDGTPIHFHIVVQDYLKSGGWGKSIFKVESQGKKSEVILFQNK